MVSPQKKERKQPVLAIAIDAAEAALVRRLIDEGKMPVLQSLLERGRWIPIESTTHIGSSSVWPTFMTGEDPETHGIYSEWCWEPATMSLRPLTGHHLNPFWQKLEKKGFTIGVLGIPFMPLGRLARGFEVSERPPFVSSHGSGSSNRAAAVSRKVANEALLHGSGQINVAGPNDLKNLQRLALDSLIGIKARGELATRLLRETQPEISIIAFTQAHEISHCLWQTVQPEHPLLQELHLNRLAEIQPSLEEIFGEVDRQIGSIIAAFAVHPTVLVFSLHGMEPGRGAPTFLTPLMCEAGFSVLAEARRQTWSDRVVHAMRDLKKRTPASFKKLYYQSLSREAVLRLAAPTLLPQYDWARTRALVIVEEHLSSIRVNLRGREARGIVTVEDYRSVCDELEQWLWTLKSGDGRALAKQVIRTADDGGVALKRRLPDIVVHWTDAALASPLRISGSEGEFYRDGERHLSQHTSEGFCILRADGEVESSPSDIALRDLGGLIERLAIS